MFGYKKQDKVPKKNCKTEDLPHNRWEVLLDCVRNDFAMLVNASLLTSLFALPLIALASLSLMLLGALAQPTWANVFPIVFYGGLISLPCFGLYFMGKTGCYMVLRRRAHNQGVMLKNTFFHSIRQNWKASAVVGLLYGVSFWVMLVGILYFSVSNTEWLAKGLGIGVCLLQNFLMYSASNYFLTQSCMYELSFGDAMRNSFALTFATLPYSLAHYAVCCIGIIIPCIFWTAAVIVVVALEVLILQSLSMLIFTLYAHKTFDKYFNQQHYPQYYRKGLYASTTKECEQREQDTII